ncbi:MAG: hypothetical protein O3A00_20300, partial [Planctomycetota bacterium]|nr:hypothetical protein [Planctomycetota bacterium]
MLRTGMFQQAVFVDYAAAQSHDPVSVAVSTISTVLGESFLDADAVTEALRTTPTLLILDNLETLSSLALHSRASDDAPQGSALESQASAPVSASDQRGVSPR